MAKNAKKTTSLWEGLEPGTTHTDTPVYDDVPTHEHTHNHTPTPKVRERKTFRAQILTYPSLIEKLDNYARMHGLSRAEAFELAVSDFLKRNT